MNTNNKLDLSKLYIYYCREIIKSTTKEDYLIKISSNYIYLSIRMFLEHLLEIDDIKYDYNYSLIKMIDSLDQSKYELIKYELIHVVHLVDSWSVYRYNLNCVSLFDIIKILPIVEKLLKRIEEV